MLDRLADGSPHAIKSISSLPQQQQHIQFCKALHSRSPLIWPYEQYHANSTLQQERSSPKQYWKILYPHRVRREQPLKWPLDHISKCYFQHPHKSQPVINRPFLLPTPFNQAEKQSRTQCTTIYMKHKISIPFHITEDTHTPWVYTHHNKKKNTLYRITSALSPLGLVT